MPSYGQTVTLTYVAWDTVNNVGKTADVGNHTLRWVKDGTASAPTNSPAEVDATNVPGVYKVVMTGTEAQCQVGTLGGKSSTSGVSIIPITITFENLPTANPAASGGLPTVGTGTGQISLTSGGVDIQTIKTQAITCAAPIAVLASVGTSSISTAQTGDSFARLGAGGAGLTAIGDSRLANLDATVSSRMATYSQPTGFLAATFPTTSTVASSTNITAGTITTVTNLTNAPANGDFTAAMKSSITTAVPTVAQVATGVWTDTTAGDFITANSIGKALYNAFTANTSVFTTASLVNAPTSGSAPTAAAIATAVWQDATAGDFTATGSIGKSLAGVFASLGSSVFASAAFANSFDSIVIETGVNARQALSPILAAAAGVISGAGTGTVVLKGGNVATTRITAAVDANGNRLNVTLSLPS